MNKIFKVIWNKTTQRLEVVSELARGAVKSSSNSVVNLAKDLSKPVLKLSLLSICLGYPTWVMAETNTDDGRFGLRNGNLYLDKNNGKYILGVYDAATGSFGFGKAQVGTKGEVFQNGKMIKPAAVGNFQLAIGHDTLIASGYKGIAIGSNYDSSASDGRRQYYFSPLDGRQGGTQGAYAISLGSGAQAIGRHTLALGANSGNGGAYNGYDDAVFLGSLSRIQSVGQGRENDNINVNNLETKYTDAVKEYNNSQTQDALNKVIEAGRNINNAALNKVEGMTIKSNDARPTLAGKFAIKTGQVSQVNGSEGTTTVSILSVGGKDGNNTMYRQIQNVAAGRIASDSNDAVTGSQLYYVRNYTGWNIGHYDDVTRTNTTTGRVNNDHTVIFKPGNYTDVWTSLDSTNRSTVNIEVKTANLGTEIANSKISKITVTDPISTDANNTVARTAGVKSVLEKFNEIKADKVDIMGYSHVNETDANNVTENRITTAKTWENQFDNNNGTYRESAGAKGNRAITSGVRANALANDSIAIGSLANVNNNWGSQSVAAERSIAIGREATVNAGQDSIAMGSGAQILHSDATTLNANNAIAIGKLAKVDQASNAIALGNNASIGGNYASNGVWKASDNSIAIGNSTTVSRENSVGIGTNVSVARENSVVIGQEAKATRERVVAIGAYATANGDRTVVIGPEATANGSKSIVIGGIGDPNAKAIAEKEQAIVIGNGAQATDNAAYSVTLGNNAKTAGATGISIGDRAQVVASAANGIALGQSAVANNSGDIAIGHSSSTSTKHTVSDIKIGDATLSKGVAATNHGTVSFGKDNDVKRQIQNVGAGEISATSSDVITGSQLYYVIKAADEIAKTEYNFQVDGRNIKTMRNNSTSAANNANNTLNFKAGDGLDVAYENNAVTYKLNADSKQAITDAKTAAQTVTTKLNEIDQSVQRAETAATNAASSATVASTAAKVAISSASAANSSATAASTSASAANSSATAASTSASAANSSATAASTSASAANSSATAASTSASAANSSATAASTSASAANSSATAASTSASAADSSATAASTSASAADSSATAASTSASAADSSATAASTSASAADSSATAASTSASAADSSATAASTSASAANSSATAASSAASAAQSSAQRIEDSGLISKDGKTAFAADNTSNRDSAKAKGKDATAAGYGSNASGKNATAIGNNATASGRNSTALGQNATATAENSVAIGQDSVANERNTVSVGRVGNERRITNVADPVNNTDAANKRYVDNAVGSVRNDLRKTEKKLRGGVAGATAMANIPQVTQPGKLMVGAGIGNYKGQSAVAVGLSKSSDNNRVIFKMSGSATTQGDYNIGAGIGYQW